MCGIAGIWNQRGQEVDAARLKPMMDLIAHRGPDDQGTWAAGPVAFGHVRLSILDLSRRAHQPFCTPDGQGLLIYNGEVYNFRQLGKDLESEGVTFRSSCDTEVVLHALHCWGPGKALRLFNGMFALAYFDRRSGELWLARDKLGIKPLYVAQHNGELVFASEIKAVLAGATLSRRVDMRSMARYVMKERCDWQWTCFEGVEALPPGSYMRLAGERVESGRHFDMLDELDPQRILETGRWDERKLVGEFKSALSHSVASHLVSDAPLATACSGGLDSSLVTALAQHHVDDLVAYVANVEGAVQEGERARRVADHLGVRLRQVEVSRVDILRLWPQCIWHFDEPIRYGQDIPLLAVAQACRQDGVKVLLTGEGSDELFGGYDWQAKTYRLWRSKRRRACLKPNSSILRRLGRHVHGLLPMDWSVMYDNPCKADLMSGDPETLLRYDCLFQPQRNPRSRGLFEKLSPIRPIEARAFLAHCLDDMHEYLQTLLMHNDRMCMAAAVEPRVPFLENRVIDLAMHFPLRAKLNRGRCKWVVKRLGAAELPRSVVHQRKIGFAMAYHFFPPVLRLLTGGIAAQILGWSSSTVASLHDRLMREPKVALNLLSLELWGRIFLQGESPQQLGEQLVAMAHS